MALRKISDKPGLDDYLPLAEHQGQTPGTFYGGKAVLYYHSVGADILIAHDELESHPAFASLANASANGGASNGENSSAKVTISAVDVWVTSENLTLYSTLSNSGVSIPYPTIALHALQTFPDDGSQHSGKEGLLMHISLNDTSMANADEDYQMLELSIIPAPPDSSAAETEPPALDAPSTSARGGSNSRTRARALFNAVSVCADLHPDPQTDEEEEEEDTAPGAGGWITAENADQYFDEDGQFVGQQLLGPGAGTVRTRDADYEDVEEEEPQNGEASMDADAKWRRTS